MQVKSQTFIFCLQIYPILGDEGCEPDEGSLMSHRRLGPISMSGCLKGFGFNLLIVGFNLLIIGADVQPFQGTSCTQESDVMRHHMSPVVLLVLAGEGSWASKKLPLHGGNLSVP